MSRTVAHQRRNTRTLTCQSGALDCEEVRYRSYLAIGVVVSGALLKRVLVEPMVDGCDSCLLV